MNKLVTVTNQMVLDIAKADAASDPRGFTGEYLPEGLRWFNPMTWLQGRLEPRRDVDWTQPFLCSFEDAEHYADRLGGRLPSLGEFPDLPTHWVSGGSQNVKRWFDKEFVMSNGDVVDWGLAHIVIVVKAPA